MILNCLSVKICGTNLFLLSNMMESSNSILISKSSGIDLTLLSKSNAIAYSKHDKNKFLCPCARLCSWFTLVWNVLSFFLEPIFPV